MQRATGDVIQSPQSETRDTAQQSRSSLCPLKDHSPKPLREREQERERERGRKTERWIKRQTELRGKDRELEEDRERDTHTLRKTEVREVQLKL